MRAPAIRLPHRRAGRFATGGIEAGMNSLRGRMIIAASLVLAGFLGFTAVALESAFRDTGLELVRERLQAQLYALLAAADPREDGALDLTNVPEPRFSLPDSGLYATVRDANEGLVWQSGSLLERPLPVASPDAPGTAVFGNLRTPWGEDLFTLAYRVHWELAPGRERIFDVAVGESRRDFEARLERFRHDLWIRLAALAIGLLLAQALVLRLGLAPLERLAGELRLIEAGERETLSEDQPRELRTLAANMNHLIGFGRRTVERHRNALADLAHALKTPLAVLRGAAEDAPADQSPLRETVLDGVARMDEALSYRLRRASSASGNSLGPPVAVEPLVRRLVATFGKVYAAKALRITLDVAPDLAVRMDGGDLTELLGNLLDNACKWARASVSIAVRPDAGRDGIQVVVEDDGPGIDPAQRERILERGVRADEQVPGEGLGLSLVREIAAEHDGGRISVEEATGGGARVCVTLGVTRSSER